MGCEFMGVAAGEWLRVNTYVSGDFICGDFGTGVDESTFVYYSSCGRVGEMFVNKP